MAFASFDRAGDEVVPNAAALYGKHSFAVAVCASYYYYTIISCYLSQHGQQIDRQRVWGSVDQEVECYRYALHLQPCRHKYRGQLPKSSGIQIQAFYQRTSRTGLPVGSCWACAKDAATYDSRSQVSSLVFFVVYAKTKRYLARPFPVAGAKKNKKSSTRPFFSHRKLRQSVIPIIDLPSLYLFH